MSIDVFAWPPVGVQGRSWKVEDPVAGLRSALTGREQLQASQRQRRWVELDVSALARGRIGGGYMEMLAQLLRGGINAVRLTSFSPNWHLDAEPDQGFHWYSIPMTAVAATSNGFPAWRIADLPPYLQVIRPGERFSVNGTVYQALNNAQADAAGTALIRVMTPVSGSGVIDFSAQESRVFRPSGGIPTGQQPTGADWSYSWTFREVFADEVGGFTERNPWV
ncbi:hypothetical protein HOY34_11065 [Xinfangfangia sp. D13-10-4-6]|uniref:hypothetical protein n=1 Tax=Pseudogemmobacter hezensis TaxID=2737662 RepID=UPI001551AB9C|nr:hypothetical protein [Pseudogemmobacter hezensis]NPD15742.1 hypothetical protein [Pseudogemmobacter hezensis]